MLTWKSFYQFVKFLSLSGYFLWTIKFKLDARYSDWECKKSVTLLVSESIIIQCSSAENPSFYQLAYPNLLRTSYSETKRLFIRCMMLSIPTKSVVKRLLVDCVFTLSQSQPHQTKGTSGKDETLGLVSVSRLKAPRLSISSQSRSHFDYW